MFLALSLNAVSAATSNNTTADQSQDKKVNTTKSTSSSTNYAAGSAAGSTKTIKVLIYSGSYAGASCVSGTKSALASANSNKILQGVTFSYATSTKLTSSILSNYDVLIMPGGSGGGYYLNTVSKSVIQNFVKNGGGYIGICAGGFAAAKHVDGYYDGWGIAPHVYAKAPIKEGKVNVEITSAGANVLKRSGTVSLAYYNGPVMYTNRGGTIFAKYADSSFYKGYAAIMGDVYGNGRVVVSGPHPELSPQRPDMMATLVAWVSKTSVTLTPKTPTPAAPKVTVSQVLSASSSVKSFYEKNKRLPNSVNINGNVVSMPKFLNLLTQTTTSVNSGSTSASFSIKNVNAPSKISGTIKKGNINKSEFLSIAKRITTFINSYGRAPNYVSTSRGNMSFTKVIYMLSKVLNFYKSNKRLPNYVAMS